MVGERVDLQRSALLPPSDAVSVESAIARGSSGMITCGARVWPEVLHVVKASVEREIESDQSACASGIVQGSSERDEEVRLTPPRHLTPLGARCACS